MSGIIAFFRASPPKAGAAFDEHRFRRVRWQTFIAMTLAYVTFYVCRLSFTVAKSALVELGITPTELGMIGSTLFFSYAIGKLVNGFIADHANVVRYMSLGLLLSAGMNLMMGMTTNALLLAIFWGIFFLEQDKAYSTLEASGIIGVNAIAGIAGTIIAGMLSDRFFPRNRSVMAGFISLLNTAGFALMLWSPHNYYTDILAMIIFGATIGALTCFLGGLIAVDISSRKAAGAALGTIGIASYAGAGLGEFLTGIIIDKTAILENGKTLYDFSTLALFWVGTGLGSALLCFTTAAIVARRHAVERQTSFSS
ncbi:MFS transporter [Klebsiella pneumoniae]